MREPWQEEAARTDRIEHELSQLPTCPRCGGRAEVRFLSAFTEELVCEDCIDREISCAIDLVEALAMEGRRRYKADIKEETC